MKRVSFTELFYKNSGYIIVLLVSLAYIASSLIMISKTGKSVSEILSTGIISMVVGTLINGVLSGIGISRGEADDKIISASQEHARAVEEILPYLDRLGEYCERENQRALMQLRTKILACYGMRYTDYFDSDGVCLGYTEYKGKDKALRQRDRQRRRAYNQACKAKIKPLIPSALTSDGGNEREPFDLGRSKREYRNSKIAGDILLRIIMAIVFGYFGVSLAGEVNFALIIWNTLQIVMYIAGGIIQMYNSYMWIVDDYRQGIIKKIDILASFKLYVKNN